ncbi:MAG: hypothetical protein ACRDE2_15780 [Chitinophagaceae bacterium]
MTTEIVTKEDLRYFREQLLEDIKNCLKGIQDGHNEFTQGLKTNDVQKLLGCSYGKVQSLRISGRLTCKKIGGTLYYINKGIKRLMDEME